MITGKTGPNAADSNTQSLSAVVTGDPTPSIEWRRNGNLLSLADSRITNSSVPEGGGMRVTLTITMVTAADRGVYKLVTRNSVGTGTESWDVPVNCELPPCLPSVLPSFHCLYHFLPLSLPLLPHSLPSSLTHSSSLSSGGRRPTEDLQWHYKCHFHLHCQSLPWRCNLCKMGGRGGREGGREGGGREGGREMGKECT